MTESEMAGPRLPHEPPLLTRDLPSLGGRVGPLVEDFRVNEIPAYVPSGTGDHRYVKIEKRDLTTPELVALLARAASVEERDIGYAGLKDKHAITTQWLSMPRRSTPAEHWKLPSYVALLEESYHTNKLRTGHLHGNRFSIRLVELKTDAESRLPALLTVIERYILNAFGEQRFGRGGNNIDTAIAWLANPRGLRGKNARFLSKLYPSVLQAELFNRYLTRRLELGLDRLLTGEVARLEGTGSNFVVEDLDREQTRYEQGELHPQGPMFGPKMRPAQAEAAELEAQILRELGLSPEQLSALGVEAPGTRRDLRLKLEELKTAFDRDEAGNLRLCVSFSLPAGSYATQVVRELCHSPWLVRRPAERPNAPATEEKSTADFAASSD